MSIVILLFVISAFCHNVCCKSDTEVEKTVRPCVVTNCSESDLIECGAKGTFWTVLKIKTGKVCICCPTEQESQKFAGN
jgi:hypothetical protein